MNDERIGRLEDVVGELRERQARLDERTERMERTLDGVATAVRSLTEARSFARGAIRATVVMWSIITGLLSAVISFGVALLMGRQGGQ